MAKPMGAVCNLHCHYCYYLEKTGLLNHNPGLMSEAVLNTYIRETLRIHGSEAVVEFAWHGGEPTLAPLAFYQQAVALQKRYGEGRKIINTLQTNGTLLSDDWCDFFAAHDFLLGLSIDGPRAYHNAYRRDSQGGTFEQTMAGVALLKKHGVAFNTLTTVNAVNCKDPRGVYQFLREISDFMQFLPVVECQPAVYEEACGQHFATPAGIHSPPLKHPVTDFSVDAVSYGIFLCEVFELWKSQDLGKKHVQIFEATLGNLRHQPAGICVHEALCGHGAVLESNGDLFCCDRYAFPEYRLGNILEAPLDTLMEKNRSFGMHKTLGLPEDCLDCPYIELCFGGCPKDRFLSGPDGTPGKNYLCEGYRLFFSHFLAL
jgi:uncharacterized protein